MRIGELAAASGLSRDALRFYERQGLLPQSGRSGGGFRQYEAAAVDRIRFIKQAQSHGLTLKEIRDLVSYQSEGGRGRCRRVRNLLAKKLAELERRRSELDAFSRTLAEYLEMCDRALGRSADVECPVVEDLGQARVR